MRHESRALRQCSAAAPSSGAAPFPATELPLENAEQALRQSEARLAGIIASAMDAIISIDEGQRIVLFNRAAEAMFRCPASAVLGQPLGRLIPERYRSGHGAHVAAFGHTGVTSRSMWTPGSLVGLRADGEEFPIEATISQVETDGRKFYTAIVRDITERQRAEQALKESEARLGGIIGSAMDAIISVNDRHEIVVFNAAAERIFGLSAAEAVGTSIHRFVPDRFRAAHAKHIRAFGETGTTTRSMGPLRPLVALRANGTEFPIEATISQVRVGGQQLFTVILRDVSERKRAELEHQQLLAEAEEANRAKADFLAVMSHELRTPLNAIGGYVELLEMGIRGPITEAQREDLSRVKRNQAHLLGLITDVLNFAKLEAGQVQFDIHDVAVDQILSHIDYLIEPQLRAKELRYEYRPGAGATLVRADEEKLRQVVLNLLSNSVKFTPPGGQVALEWTVDCERVHIRVRDTGCGIPAEKLDAIFNPFMQVDKSLTRRTEGTGLGLAISHDLARGMGGDLTAESALGAGSTFTVTLPRASAAQ